MRTRFVLTIVALVRSLSTAFGSSIPAVIAQEATPEAISPPQDLLPAAEVEGEGQTANIN